MLVEIRQKGFQSVLPVEFHVYDTLPAISGYSNTASKDQLSFKGNFKIEYVLRVHKQAEMSQEIVTLPWNI